MTENEIETLWELKKGNLFVEVVKGNEGVYFAMTKNGNGMLLTLDEASYLRTLILRAVEYDRKEE
ncbi:MAG: hypothetical protein ACXABD_20885 [Candidatus Thorarchaeota archaeon]|jgi:hypothetical protein